MGEKPKHRSACRHVDWSYVPAKDKAQENAEREEREAEEKSSSASISYLNQAKLLTMMTAAVARDAASYDRVTATTSKGR
jgi:hypothetical protein